VNQVDFASCLICGQQATYAIQQIPSIVYLCYARNSAMPDIQLKMTTHHKSFARYFIASTNTMLSDLMSQFLYNAKLSSLSRRSRICMSESLRLS